MVLLRSLRRIPGYHPEIGYYHLLPHSFLRSVLQLTQHSIQIKYFSISTFYLGTPSYWWIFSSLPNPSSCTMALGSTQPLTEMSTSNFPAGKKLPARRADNLAAIYEPNVSELWKPQPLATLRASTACIGIALPLPYHFLLSTTNMEQKQILYAHIFSIDD
jgi:hypothetical protein